MFCLQTCRLSVHTNNLSLQSGVILPVRMECVLRTIPAGAVQDSEETDVQSLVGTYYFI